MGDGAEAGLCARCWEGLLPLPEGRCARCALVHAEGECPEATAWERGDALWDYHGGRPPLGALLLPGIKRGETAWRRALLERLARAPLPDWASEAGMVTSAPSSGWHRLIRGFDLAEEAGRIIARRIGRPFHRILTKRWRSGRQAARSESERRRLPVGAVALLAGRPALPGVVLLVDDVWTTGTTLIRCAEALKTNGGEDVRVFCLFRAQ